jgi:hypothetical protein
MEMDMKCSVGTSCLICHRLGYREAADALPDL